MSYIKDINFIVLIGQVLTVIEGAEAGGDTVKFTTDTGKTYELYHSQDCCESVIVESVTGNPNDVLLSPILRAEENILTEWPEDAKQPEYLESHTWTTFVLATEKGVLMIRWLGSSNGYYSESVSFIETTKPEAT